MGIVNINVKIKERKEKKKKKNTNPTEPSHLYTIKLNHTAQLHFLIF